MAQRQIEQDPMAAAIERVLEAERSAEVTLQNCRLKAEAMVSDAREQAAAIARRADNRISQFHTAYFSKISTEVAKLADAPISTGEVVGGAIDDARLVEAAQRLAAKLTGGT
jgi:vacuolar-type H+-ATPase subunit H